MTVVSLILTINNDHEVIIRTAIDVVDRLLNIKVVELEVDCLALLGSENHMFD